MRKLLLFAFLGIVVFLSLGAYLLWQAQYRSRAVSIKGHININTKKISGPLFPNWRAIAQGGEEPNGRMLQNVVPQLTELSPRYIRIDHIYDFYNVVGRNGTELSFFWDRLDETVCDILATGAKPFFALGYMPSVISTDGTPIGLPGSWQDWQTVVQKTVERYSGTKTTLCNGQFNGNSLTGIYYEVWNEPDLETFGSWKLYGSAKDYKLLYRYSVLGANAARDVHPFYIGGPATTALYKNWIQGLLRYVVSSNLRIDFLSWHHYTTNPDGYRSDVEKLNGWLSDDLVQFQRLPKIISEWGYDASYTPMADSDGGAAYTAAAIAGLANSELEMAFSFEAKDGPTPRWGILSYDGREKPRYRALRILNKLEGFRLKVEGEGTYLRAIASQSPGKTTVILVNYDPAGQNAEMVPVTVHGLAPGEYTMTLTYAQNLPSTVRTRTVESGPLVHSVTMPANAIAALTIQKKP